MSKFNPSLDLRREPKGNFFVFKFSLKKCRTLFTEPLRALKGPGKFYLSRLFFEKKSSLYEIYKD